MCVLERESVCVRERQEREREREREIKTGRSTYIGRVVISHLYRI